MNPLLHCGFQTYIPSEKIWVIADYRTAGARDIVRSMKESKPWAVLDCSRGRKRLSLIILTGGMLVISAIPRKQLAGRLGLINHEDEELHPERTKYNLKGKRKYVKRVPSGNQEETPNQNIPTD